MESSFHLKNTNFSILFQEKLKYLLVIKGDKWTTDVVLSHTVKELRSHSPIFEIHPSQEMGSSSRLSSEEPHSAHCLKSE